MVTTYKETGTTHDLKRLIAKSGMPQTVAEGVALILSEFQPDEKVSLSVSYEVDGAVRNLTVTCAPCAPEVAVTPSEPPAEIPSPEPPPAADPETPPADEPPAADEPGGGDGAAGA